MKIGVYIHIPFCKSHCFYCDFCRTDNAENSKIIKYINALEKEIIENAEVLSQYEIDSVYFGGGTPSFIDSQFIADILNILRSCTVFDEDCEITMEVNPESVTEGKLKDYKQAGINRISMGLQSANDSVLKNIGRASNLQTFEKAYNLIIENGFLNVSTDVICGLPGDSAETFENTIKYVVSLPYLKHISAYSLELHENTKLDFLVKNRFLALPSEEEERKMKHKLDDVLSANGFNMYEISNYAIPGFTSRHNIKYWTGKYYLGFGASAASYINSTRYSNIDDIEEYITNISNNLGIRKEVEELSEQDLQKEFVILGLRLKDGICIEEFEKKFNVDIYSVFKEQIDKNLKLGLLEKYILEGKNHLKLTAKGQDLANVVWREFI